MNERSSKHEAGTPVTLNRPVFVLSVDFELLWGYVLCPKDRAVALLLRDETQGRSSVLTLLSILDRHGLPATWATVGNLFLDPDHTHPGLPGAVHAGLLGQADRP